ncbi:MAG: hypothetical protein H7839_11845 [Magnetococcus sp. YQC-5]
MSYKINDDVRISLGVERYGGHDYTPLGSLRPNFDGVQRGALLVLKEMVTCPD